jgi:hypothetical protein
VSTTIATATTQKDKLDKLFVVVVARSTLNTFCTFFLLVFPLLPLFTQYELLAGWLLATMTILFRANLQHFLFIIQETQAHIQTTTLKLKSMRRLLLKPENHCKQ